MTINLVSEIQNIKEKQEELVLKLVEEAKSVDGTYKGALNHLTHQRGEFLYKNDREALAYFNKAVAVLEMDLEERINFLQDKKIY